MDSFIENLKQEVQCSLCKHTLIEPTILQCFHTFCKPCIKKHAQLKEQVNIFECPSCNSETLFQEFDEDEDLEPSERHSRMLKVMEFVESEKDCSISASHSPVLCHCFDCEQSLCDDCLKCHTAFSKNHRVVFLSDLKKEDAEVIMSKEPPCNTHKNESVEMFCKDCEILVCLLCLKDDHKDHKTMTLQDFKTNKKALLSHDLKNIEILQRRVSEKEQQQETATKIKNSGEKAKKEVKKRTKELVKQLFDQEEQLLTEIQKSVTRADRNLRMIRHAVSAQHHIRDIIENGTAADLIGCCHDDGGCTKFTYSPFRTDMAGILYEPNNDLRELINDSQLGRLRFTELSSHAVSEISELDKKIIACEKAKLTLVTKHFSGKLNYDDCDEVDIQLTPEDDVKLVERKDKTGGEIQVEFIPRVPGQLTVEVKLNGNHVSNSPLSVDVKQQVIKETKNSQLKIALNTATKRCSGIAVNRANTRIALADLSTHFVRFFTMDGDLVQIYGGRGSQEGQLSNPNGLAFLNDEDLVIADNGNNRICIVNTTTGTLIKSFGCKGEGNGQFSSPRGVHVDDDCNIIVSDPTNKRVQVFTKDGEYQYKICLPNQRLFYPVSTVRHNGLFYISDSNSAVHVVEMKDNSPTVVSTIGGEGTTGVQGKNLQGIAIDNDNNLLVWSGGCVHKFSLDGRYIGKTMKLSVQPYFNILYITALNDGQIICTLSDKGVFCLK